MISSFNPFYQNQLQPNYAPGSSDDGSFIACDLEKDSVNQVEL